MNLIFAKIPDNGINAHIDSLWGDEKYRKNGIDSELKKLSEIWAKNEGARQSLKYFLFQA